MVNVSGSNGGFPSLFYVCIHCFKCLKCTIGYSLSLTTLPALLCNASCSVCQPSSLISYWILMTVGEDINPNIFGDPLTFNHAQPIDHSGICPALLCMTTSLVEGETTVACKMCEKCKRLYLEPVFTPWKMTCGVCRHNIHASIFHSCLSLSQRWGS